MKLSNKFITIPTAALLGISSVEGKIEKADARPYYDGNRCDLSQEVQVQYQIRGQRDKVYSECYSKNASINPNNGRQNYAGSNSLPNETIGAFIETYIEEPGKVCVFANGRTFYDPKLSVLTNHGTRYFISPRRVEGANIDYIIPEPGIVKLRARMNPQSGQKQISIGSGNQCN